MHPKIILACLLTLFSSLVFAQSKREENVKSEFLEIAFLELNNKKLPLRKWENVDTLNYFIQGELRFFTDKNWNRFIAQTEALIQIPISPTDQESNAEIIIVFGDISKYLINYSIIVPSKINPKSFSWTNRKHNGKYQLTQVSICLDPNIAPDSKTAKFYLIQSFYKSLGILGTNDDPYSIFQRQYSGTVSGPSKLDKQLITIFYNDSIQAGSNFFDTKADLDKIDIEEIINSKKK